MEQKTESIKGRSHLLTKFFLFEAQVLITLKEAMTQVKTLRPRFFVPNTYLGIKVSRLLPNFI